MIEVKWFQFAMAEVVHLVTFDDVVSLPGNPPECEIGFSGPAGPKARILRSTLIKLCEGGHANFAGDAS
jgi:hypothetical protein